MNIFYFFPMLKIVMQFLLNHKTKQHLLYKFTVFVIFIIYIHYSPQKQHPQFLLEESSMPQSKKISKKVATLEKMTFLYRSKSLISLWSCVSVGLKDSLMSRVSVGLKDSQNHNYKIIENLQA